MDIDRPFTHFAMGTTPFLSSPAITDLANQFAKIPLDAPLTTSYGAPLAR